jgi:hypothetical protein
LAILVAGTLLQLWGLSTDFVVPRVSHLWPLRGYAAWERSALIGEGEGFLEFIAFLRRAIPVSGKVVLPPHSDVSEVGAFAYPTFIQYFFVPREVLNCSEPVDDCVRRLTGPNSYIVRVGRFPPALAASEHKRYIPFRDEMGVYAPK